MNNEQIAPTERATDIYDFLPEELGLDEIDRYETERGTTSILEQHERDIFTAHIKTLHKRNDLLQQRLDDAQAMIARMQAEKLIDPKKKRLLRTSSALRRVLDANKVTFIK